jgi:hypothetical protein
VQESVRTDAYAMLAEAVEEIGKCWQLLYEMRTEEARYWREKCEFLELMNGRA